MTLLNVSSWSEPHAQLIINDITHRTVFTEADMSTATAGEVAGSLIYGLMLITVCLWAGDVKKEEEEKENEYFNDVWVSVRSV